MRKPLVAGALAVGILGIGGTVGAQDLGLSSHNHDKVDREVWLYAMPTDQDTYLDAHGGEDDNILEVGDRNIFSEDLYQVRDSQPVGEAIGRVFIECVVVEVTGTPPENLDTADLVAAEQEETPEVPFDAALHCEGAMDIGHDRQMYLETLIRFSDFESDDPTIRGAVTGGTGALAGATGEFRIRELPTEGDEGSNAIYHIRLLKK